MTIKPQPKKHHEYVMVRACEMPEGVFNNGMDYMCQVWHDGIAMQMVPVGESGNWDCIGFVDWRSRQVTWPGLLEECNALEHVATMARSKMPETGEVGRRSCSFMTQWTVEQFDNLDPSTNNPFQLILVGPWKLPTYIEPKRNRQPAPLLSQPNTKPVRRSHPAESTDSYESWVARQ